MGPGARELCREAKWGHSGRIVKTVGGRQYFRKTATALGAVPLLGNVPLPATYPLLSQTQGVILSPWTWQVRDGPARQNVAEVRQPPSWTLKDDAALLLSWNSTFVAMEEG